MKRFISLLMTSCLLVLMSTVSLGYGTGNNLPPADPIVLKDITKDGIRVNVLKDKVIVTTDYVAPHKRPEYSTPVDLKVVGKTIEIKNDVQPFINSFARTMVPVRVLVTLIGGDVAYNATTRTVTVKKGLRNIMLTIGSNIAIVNGQTITLDASAEIFEGRTIVPVRFVTEALGYNVGFVPVVVSIN